MNIEGEKVYFSSQALEIPAHRWLAPQHGGTAAWQRGITEEKQFMTEQAAAAAVAAANLPALFIFYAGDKLYISSTHTQDGVSVIHTLNARIIPLVCIHTSRSSYCQNSHVMLWGGGTSSYKP